MLLKANENAFRHQESATGSPQSQIKEERQKVKAGDLLFLYLTAWKAGLPIKGHRGLVTESLLRIDGELFRFRVDGQDVFKEIKNFRVLYQEQKTNGAMVPSRSFSTPVAERNAENDSLVANISRFLLSLDPFLLIVFMVVFF